MKTPGSLQHLMEAKTIHATHPYAVPHTHARTHAHTHTHTHTQTHTHTHIADTPTHMPAHTVWRALLSSVRFVSTLNKYLFLWSCDYV